MMPRSPRESSRAPLQAPYTINSPKLAPQSSSSGVQPVISAPGLVGTPSLRVSLLPNTWTYDKVRKWFELLESPNTGSDSNGENVIVLSLVPNGYTQVGTVCFKSMPHIFSACATGHEIRVDMIDDGHKHILTVDCDFFGITPLYCAVNPEVDIVAVTGLSGHAMGSWKIPRRYPVWLRDFLPRDIPNCRILTYGYDSKVEDSISNSSIRDYGRQFLESVHNVRQNENDRHRPIIFIGHSLGGLVITQALSDVAQDGSESDITIAESAAGMFLFGVPFNGLNHENLLSIAEGKHNFRLVHDLMEGSAVLPYLIQNFKTSFRPRFKRCLVFSFYETEATPTTVELPNGKLGRDGPLVHMVKKESATILSHNTHDQILISGNHSTIVKFKGPSDVGYQTVVRKLADTVKLYFHQPKPSAHSHFGHHVNQKQIANVCSSQDRDLQKFGEIPLNKITTQEIIHTGRDLTPPSILAEKLVKPFVVDQTGYQESLLGNNVIDYNSRDFWFFHNIDYQSWSNFEGKVNILIVTGSSFLENIASQMINSCQLPGMLLYFFWGSVKSAKRPTGISQNSQWYSIAPYCTFIKQIMDHYPQPEQQSLLETFIWSIRGEIDEAKLAKVPEEPTKAFVSLLCLATVDNIWTALEAMLADAAKLHKQEVNQTPQKRNLTFILDLDNSINDGGVILVNIFRRAVKVLRRNYKAVRFLVMNMTTKSGLVESPSEIYLEYDKERQECLSSLWFNNTRFQKVSTRCEHTFEWLQLSPEYRAWSSPESSGFLFVEGKPGSGKSTLLRYFVENLACFTDRTIVAKFFYSHRDGELERDHLKMFQSLLFDILKRDETLFIHFQALYRSLQESKSSWTIDMLKTILRNCKGHSVNKQFVLIVDALDESTDVERANVVQYLYDLSVPNSKGSSMKVFLASRPLQDIHQALTHRNNQIRLQERNQKDIEFYMDKFLHDSNHMLYSYKDLVSRFRDYVVANADGVFLWVRLLGEELMRLVKGGSRRRTILNFLEKTPKDLESYYVYMLEKLIVNDPDDIKSGDNFLADDRMRILQFCLFSHRAVEVIELADALAIPGGIDEDEYEDVWEHWEEDRPGDMRIRLMQCVGCFVDIKGSYTTSATELDELAIVQVMHQTVREFFLRPHDAVKQSELQICDALRARTMIRTTCVRYLYILYREMKDKIRISDLYWWSLEDQEMIVQYLDTRPLLKYSLEYLSIPESTDPNIEKVLLELTCSLKKNPQSGAFFILNRLIGDSMRHEDQTRINHLLAVAAEKGCAVAVGNLLMAGAEIDAIAGIHQSRALHLASSRGHTTTVQVLLDRGANIEGLETEILDPKNSEKMIPYGKRPLHSAAKGGHETTVRLLLDRGAIIEALTVSNPNRQIVPGKRALHIATKRGQEAIVRLLIDRGSNIEATNGKKQKKALEIAATKGYSGMVIVLIEHGAKVAGRSLDLAAENGHEACVRLLLDYGAKINHDHLVLAASNGHDEAIKVLLDNGAKATYRALNKAVYGGYAATTQLLLDHGLDINHIDEQGQTALHHAVSSNAQGRGGVIKLLLDSGVEINCADEGGLTALHLACTGKFSSDMLMEILNEYREPWEGRDVISRVTEAEHESTVRLLLDYRADINIQDKQGQTALHLATRTGREMIVQLLLDRGAEVDEVDNSGNSALHLAVVCYEHITRILLKYGADINGGALHIAAKADQTEIVKLLLSRDADINKENRLGKTVIESTEESSLETKLVLQNHNNSSVNYGLKRQRSDSSGESLAYCNVSL